MVHPEFCQGRNPFRYFNSSPEVLRLAVMMYVGYPLSLRQVEDLLSERGIDVCRETVRYWWNRFGQLFATVIRKRRAQHHSYSNWRWHLDEVFVRISGETLYLWRAFDHEGEVLEVIATKRRDRRAALRSLKRAMKRYGEPRSIVTDRLDSYRAALKVIGDAAAQTCGRWLNNRAENSHQPFRRRDRAIAKFRDVGTLQKFGSVTNAISPAATFSNKPGPLRWPSEVNSQPEAADCRFYKSCPVSLTMPLGDLSPGGSSRFALITPSDRSVPYRTMARRSSMSFTSVNTTSASIRVLIIDNDRQNNRLSNLQYASRPGIASNLCSSPDISWQLSELDASRCE